MIETELLGFAPRILGEEPINVVHTQRCNTCYTNTATDQILSELNLVHIMKRNCSLQVHFNIIIHCFSHLVCVENFQFMNI
jgi:hypothetical protein